MLQNQIPQKLGKELNKNHQIPVQPQSSSEVLTSEWRIIMVCYNGQPLKLTTEFYLSGQSLLRTPF